MELNNFLEIPSFIDIMILLLFLIPGFISTKVATLIFPSEKTTLSKSYLEVFIYSALNYAAFSWLIFLIFKYGIFNLIILILLLLLVLFVAPIFWPIICYHIVDSKFLKNKLRIHHTPLPWDYIFGNRESFWIIVHLKDGRRIGGLYSANSFSSSYPQREQLYLQETWELDKKGAFKKRVERTKGILIKGDEISMVEFFK